MKCVIPQAKYEKNLHFLCSFTLWMCYLQRAYDNRIDSVYPSVVWSEHFFYDNV